MNKKLVVLFFTFIFIVYSKSDEGIRFLKDAVKNDLKIINPIEMSDLIVPKLYESDSNVSLNFKIVNLWSGHLKNETRFSCYGAGQLYWITPFIIDAQVRFALKIFILNIRRGLS